MAGIETSYQPGVGRRVTDAAMRLSIAVITPVVYIVVALAVVAALFTLVFSAIGIELGQAAAASVVVVLVGGAAMGGGWVGYRVRGPQQVQMVEAPRVIDNGEPKRLPPPEWNTPAVDRWTTVAPGHMVDAGSLRVMAERVYAELWGQGRELTQANIKQVVAVSDNSQCTAICNTLAERGLAFKESDAKTARWKWARPCPTPSG